MEEHQEDRRLNESVSGGKQGKGGIMQEAMTCRSFLGEWGGASEDYRSTSEAAKRTKAILEGTG